MGARDLLPILTMVIVQMGYAGMNILSSLAMDSGMSPLVHVAYRQFFATIVIAPFAYFFERKTRPKMTLYTLFLIFLSSIFGATMNQTFYFVGLHHSTPTIACALSNLLPAVTFLIAIPFRMESVGIRRKSSQAKIIGTLVCVGGAMLLSFYHGETVVGKSNIHWKYAEKMDKGSSTDHETNNLLLGPLLVVLSTAAWAAWFVIQARTSEKYPAPYTTSALMCLMASFQCGIIALVMEPSKSAWSLSPSIRVISSLYAGVVCTAMAFGLMSWCIQKKGPLYVSVFSPLLLIIVAILSWALLQEKLYIGTAIGSALIVVGLYAVLWGKNREKSAVNSVDDNVEEDEKETDMEMQVPNSNLHAQV